MPSPDSVDRNRIPQPPDDGDPTDIGISTPSAPQTTPDQNPPKVVPLGNGYSYVSTVELNPNYDASQPEMMIAYKVPQYITKTQIVADKDTANAGASASVQAAAISTQGANQRAAVQAEIDRAKNAADQAHSAALLALSQGNADEAKRQFDISSKELQRSHDMDFAIRQQEQNLAGAKFGNDVYNKLAELASNPRNYMEQFFRMRGQTPPANSAQYGNTSVTGPGLATFEQFLPNFLRSTGLASGQQGAQQTMPQPAPQQNPALSGPSGASTAGLSGFDAATGKPRLSPTDPDALGLIASHPGMYTMTSPQQAQPYIDQLKKEGNDATIYASSYRQPQQFADGGQLRMTAPHAIVNLLSGRVAAIAGEERGRGPQGFVPETATFDGKAILDQGYEDKQNDPLGPDPGTVNTFTGGVKTPGGTFSYPTFDTTTPSTPTIQGPSEVVVPSTPISPLPAPLVHDQTIPPPVTSGVTAAQIAEAQRLAAAANTANPNLQPIVDRPRESGIQNLEPAPNGQTLAGAGLVPPVIPPFTPGPTPPNTPGPSINPTGGNAWGGPVIQPSPPTTSDLPTLTQTPSGLGRNPQYLPEDQAATDPIIAQMLAQGAFPPFLQRIFAQQKGLAGLGTNVPQLTDLPPGVPLVSKLAYNQMTPSEQQAFASFLSAHGLDLADYLTLVEQASPQGGTSSVNPAIPKFLQQ